MKLFTEIVLRLYWLMDGKIIELSWTKNVFWTECMYYGQEVKLVRDLNRKIDHLYPNLILNEN